MVKFKAKIRDGGSANIVTIPRGLITCNILKQGTEYEFDVKESQNDEV